MRFLKNNLKLIIGFIIGIILAGGIAYATTSANQVNYTTSKNAEISTVEQALNDLYSKSNKTPQQVATLTTQGAIYTMQNDGYIIGTAAATDGSVALLEINNKTIILANESHSGNRDVSVYAEKGDVIKTRNNAGSYNLIVYEWK